MSGLKVRTNAGPLRVVVCELCACLVLALGEEQHRRWHAAQRDDSGPHKAP